MGVISAWAKNKVQMNFYVFCVLKGGISREIREGLSLLYKNSSPFSYKSPNVYCFKMANDILFKLKNFFTLEYLRTSLNSKLT